MYVASYFYSFIRLSDAVALVKRLLDVYKRQFTTRWVLEIF